MAPTPPCKTAKGKPCFTSLPSAPWSRISSGRRSPRRLRSTGRQRPRPLNSPSRASSRCWLSTRPTLTLRRRRAATLRSTSLPLVVALSWPCNSQPWALRSRCPTRMASRRSTPCSQVATIRDPFQSCCCPRSRSSLRGCPTAWFTRASSANCPSIRAVAQTWQGSTTAGTAAVVCAVCALRSVCPYPNLAPPKTSACACSASACSQTARREHLRTYS
mmetsp:Transcript_49466/g.114306  ORF Transcript_49466/g.114306 Transcript_49466/m.114306 type:complete len:218 (+) Transcript_49466:2639-3292(+)